MLKNFLLTSLLLSSAVPFAWSQTADSFTPQEAAVVAAIKAQNASAEEAPALKTKTLDKKAAAQPRPARGPKNADLDASNPVPKTKETDPLEEVILLPETTKQEAFKEQAAEEGALDRPKADVPNTNNISAQSLDQTHKPQTADAINGTDTDDSDQTDLVKEKQKCLTVAYIDIDEAFNQHPRTVAVKEQIRLKILSKEQEVDAAKQIIDALNMENSTLARLLKGIKPFYRRIVVQPEMAPQIQESTNTLVLTNLLNQLCFSRCEVLSATPLNTPEQVDDVVARMTSNKKIIAERSFFIDNYKYTTREEILKLEEKEVKAILKDIYTEIKSFAKKRNIGAVVRKDEILYGEKPINVTKDFITRLKKSKKYRKIEY